METRSETDPATGASRTWTNSYYDTPPEIAGLLRTTDGLGHVTEYLAYDGAGRPLQIKDPNGVITTLAYHLRGWLSSQSVAGETTSFGYDNVGSLTRITQPSGSFIDFEYDDAHRLTAIADRLGNRIEYTLDAAGNHTAEHTFAPNALGGQVVKRQLSRVYDTLGRLDQLLTAAGEVTDFDYDPNGNLTQVDDPLPRPVTTHAYDALDRLINTVDVALDETGYQYDSRDNLIQVTDPLGHITQYTYDRLDNLKELLSPDTGTTVYTYDEAGNRKTQTDARGVVAEFIYHALNRLTDIAYPSDLSLNVTFAYDRDKTASAA